MNIEILKDLGSKPSISEERGLAQIKETDLMIFSPGISTAGFAEIRMAKQNPNRKIIATTIDKEGLNFARNVINQMGLDKQIETREENITSEWNYPENYFDFIYARLILHYLSAQELDKVLSGFKKSLKPGGRTFIVLRSEKSINPNDPNHSYDPITKFTRESFLGKNEEIVGTGLRYFHTKETISNHLQKAGLQIDSIEQYPEILYKDFLRKEISKTPNDVIEAVGSKPNLL